MSEHDEFSSESPYAQATESQPPPGGDSDTSAGAAKQLSTKAVALVVVCVTLAAIAIGVVAWMVFAGGSSDGGRRYGPPNDRYVDGQLMTVSNSKIILFAGARQINFKIRSSDAKSIDISHAQLHANVGIPTRVYYISKDGAKYATWLDDAPKPE